MDIINSRTEMEIKGSISKQKRSIPISIKSYKLHAPDEKRQKNAEPKLIKCKSLRCTFCNTREKPHRTRIHL